MEERMSVFDSNKEHKNPLITTGIVMIGIIMVVDYLQVVLNLFFDNESSMILENLVSLTLSVYSLIWISTIVLGCICTRKKVLFLVFQCVFALFLIKELIYTFRIYTDTSHYITYIMRAVSENDLRTFVNMLYPLIRQIFVLFAAAILAKGLFMPHRYKGDGYLNMALHIILLLLMPVFYKLCWVFRTTRVVNNISNEPKRNAFLQTLLCYIIPFYSLYWTYSTARRSDVVAVSKGMQSDTATLCLILQIFLPFIPPMIIQDKINQVVSSNVVVIKTIGNSAAKPNSTKNISIPEELKKYKELLDCQAITQEEYDKKKSELLNL